VAHRRFTSNSAWGAGRGGRGADAPAYTRRLQLLIQVRDEFVERFPDEALYIVAGIDRVPIDWVNQRLDELGETWHVTWCTEGHEMPPLP